MDGIVSPSNAKVHAFAFEYETLCGPGSDHDEGTLLDLISIYEAYVFMIYIFLIWGNVL